MHFKFHRAVLSFLISFLSTREATREPFLPSPQESHLVWEDQNYKIIETGAIIAGIYRKPTNTEQYLNFDSKYHLGDKRLYTLLSSQRRKTERTRLNHNRARRKLQIVRELNPGETERVPEASEYR